MADPILVKKWMAKADEDFGYASASLRDEMEYFPQICFHFHQAAEKYLKAYVIKNNLCFKKIHDLMELVDICTKHDKAFESLKDACAFLNRFYLSTRYPVHWDSNFTKQDAQGAKKAASSIRNTVMQLTKIVKRS